MMNSLKSPQNPLRRAGGRAWGKIGMGAAALVACFSLPAALATETELFDQPIVAAGASYPTNLLLLISGEHPTAGTFAHRGGYDAKTAYAGYFDPYKCYTYNNSKKYGYEYFEPEKMATIDELGNINCAGAKIWSGNGLNYATMSSLDIFRLALTGGDRIVDTAASQAEPGITILQRTIQPEGNLSLMDWREVAGVYQGQPLGFKNKAGYQGKTGADVELGKSMGLARVAVRVCDNRKGDEFLEDNCEAYTYTEGNTSVVTYKPVGLIQKQHAKLRVGVFSYLNNYLPENLREVERDGGVLRARMKSVGPGATNPEWSATNGTFFHNPDPADASASGVSRSGVINYVNKFGAAGTYAYHDSPSEMVAEALRYLMGGSPTPSYYNHKNASTYYPEFFPVITDWSDPVTHRCQRNVILGIGDRETSWENNFGDLTSFKAIANGDPRVWTQKVSQSELGNDKLVTNDSGAGTKVAQWGLCSNPASSFTAYPGLPCGGNLMAGMAYWAHTQDIRPDLEGKQSVDFSWFDVAEINQSKKLYRSQYWLLSKYGGFEDVNKNGVFDAAEDTWKSANRKVVDLDNKQVEVPDNLYTPQLLDAMLSGLTPQVMAQANQTVTNNLVFEENGLGDNVYQTSYESTHWSGDVKAMRYLGFNDDGSLKATELWRAAAKIDGQDWSTGRRIVTGKVPFRFDKLTPTQQATLGSDEARQKAVLEYLRGNRLEDHDKAYRRREHLLGDIVNASPVVVGAPNAQYLDVSNPGYQAFRTTHKNRAKRLYVGANDGMLHALDATDGNGQGSEVWAYIPTFLFAGPNNTPQVDGLQALSRPGYSHHYYVDATPVVTDVDFLRVYDGPGGTPPQAGQSDWHTLLVGGLGKGGKGWYALDVTNPEAVSEDVAAQKVLWEFGTGQDMGFSYGKPLVVKTRAWGWVVIFPSGYNNKSGGAAIYVVNAKTGQLITKATSNAGDDDEPTGLAHISAYFPAYSEHVATEIYGGDLRGNVWRFDLPETADDVTGITANKLAQLTDEHHNPQPVTVAPLVVISPKSLLTAEGERRWVVVGTGQLLSGNDINQGPGLQTQTVYAFRDGGRTSAEEFAGKVVTRDDLKRVTNLLDGSIIQTPQEDNGWYFDLTDKADDGATERVWKPMSSIAGTGIVTFTGVLPYKDPLPNDTGDDCTAGATVDGRSRIYAVRVENAQSLFPGESYLSVNHLVRDTQLTYDKDGNIVIVADGQLAGPKEGSTIAKKRTRQVNWRTLK
jgi:type IV pilus assembly protein PilY1